MKKRWKQIQGKNLSQLDNWASLTLQAFQSYWNLYVIYSSLPNRRDVTAINFLRIFYPQLCYFSHHVY